MRNIDGHIHTDFSDGEFKIRDVLNMILEKEISTFSITDHDNIDSCRYMDQFDLNLLKEYIFEYIRGVEISSKMGKYDMHILGYNFNYTENMDKLLSKIRELRRIKLLEQINQIKIVHGIRIEPEDIHNLMLKQGTAGKANLIMLLHQNGCGGTNREIHQRYVKSIKTETCFDADIEESIGVIKEAKGIPVLAHPKEIENKFHIDINEIIKDIINKGIEGIEAYNSLHTLEDIQRFLKIAKQYNLLISGGSDYHGLFTKSGVEIGHVSKEKMKIKNLSLVDKINEIGLVA